MKVWSSLKFFNSWLIAFRQEFLVMLVNSRGAQLKSQVGQKKFRGMSKGQNQYFCTHSESVFFTLLSSFITYAHALKNKFYFKTRNKL